jgi:hypothetical protein
VAIVGRSSSRSRFDAILSSPATGPLGLPPRITYTAKQPPTSSTSIQKQQTQHRQCPWSCPELDELGSSGHESDDDDDDDDEGTKNKSNQSFETSSRSSTSKTYSKLVPSQRLLSTLAMDLSTRPSLRPPSKQKQQRSRSYGNMSKLRRSPSPSLPTVEEIQRTSVKEAQQGFKEFLRNSPTVRQRS